MDYYCPWCRDDAVNCKIPDGHRFGYYVVAKPQPSSRHANLSREIEHVQAELTKAAEQTRRTLPGGRRLSAQQLAALQRQNATAAQTVRHLQTRLRSLHAKLAEESRGTGYHEQYSDGDFVTVSEAIVDPQYSGEGYYFVSYGQRGAGKHVTLIYDQDGNLIRESP